MSINAIDSTPSILSGISSLASAFEDTDTKTGGSFSEMLVSQIKGVDQTVKEAEDTSRRAMLGNAGVSLHDAQIATAKAELDMRLLVQVRSKALEMYRDIMTMQV
ncbi:MAG: flagellar hook-basal body complex protein FliE [Magnetococcales bacterium]|nr:flagellar hook-basal body complex protein FliE [Magnetococcales bacterium]